MAPMVKIDPKYNALGSKTRVASRGNPQMTALQLIIHYQVKIAKNRIHEIFKSLENHNSRFNQSKTLG